MLKVKSGKAIFVTTLEGEEIAGKAGTATPGAITVWTAVGPRVVALADIQKVQKHDESWTGAVIGGSAGLLMGLADALIKKRKTIYVVNAPQPRSRASLVIRGRMVGLAIAF